MPISALTHNLSQTGLHFLPTLQEQQDCLSWNGSSEVLLWVCQRRIWNIRRHMWGSTFSGYLPSSWPAFSNWTAEPSFRHLCQTSLFLAFSQDTESDGIISTCLLAQRTETGVGHLPNHYNNEAWVRGEGTWEMADIHVI